MQSKKRESKAHEMKDPLVPPVKGAVNGQDLLRRPAALFGHGHPAEFVQMDNASLFDNLQ